MSSLTSGHCAASGAKTTISSGDPPSSVPKTWRPGARHRIERDAAVAARDDLTLPTDDVDAGRRPQLVERPGHVAELRAGLGCAVAHRGERGLGGRLRRHQEGRGEERGVALRSREDRGRTRRQPRCTLVHPTSPEYWRSSRSPGSKPSGERWLVASSWRSSLPVGSGAGSSADAEGDGEAEGEAEAVVPPDALPLAAGSEESPPRVRAGGEGEQGRDEQQAGPHGSDARTGRESADRCVAESRPDRCRPRPSREPPRLRGCSTPPPPACSRACP